MLPLLMVVGILVLWVAFALRRQSERDLRGKVVLLTGAAGGLGRRMALSFARRGCLVACADIASKPNEETANQVNEQQNGKVARTYTVDLTKKESITALVEAVVKDFGRIDILVNNAGCLQGGTVSELDEDDISMILDVNLRAAILLTRLVLPLMKAQRSGQLVAVSSIAAIAPHHMTCVYAASKAGLSHYMECVYRELRSEGLDKDILLTTIHPYFMATYGKLVSQIRLDGIVGWALPFLDADWAGRFCVHTVAVGYRTVYIPPYIGFLIYILTLAPMCLQNFIYEHIFSYKVLPILSYQKHRHGEMDGEMLHELLSKGYPLESDPQPVFQKLYEEYTAKGESLPYNFNTFTSTIERFYKSRNLSVPPIVQRAL